MVAYTFYSPSLFSVVSFPTEVGSISFESKIAFKTATPVFVSAFDEERSSVVFVAIRNSQSSYVPYLDNR